jgi:hypothetical protein
LVKDLKISSHDSENLGYVYELDNAAAVGH